MKSGVVNEKLACRVCADPNEDTTHASVNRHVASALTVALLSQLDIMMTECEWVCSQLKLLLSASSLCVCTCDRVHLLRGYHLLPAAG